MKMIPLAELHPHPGNPRLAPREDVVEQIAAQLNGRLDEAHALLVRPNGAGFQIISGHHRALAAQRAGLEAVPCWVREMSDEDAYMALALNNAQGELRWYEEGKHAFDCQSHDTVAAYAEALCKADAADLIGRKKNAWRVWISAMGPKNTPPDEYKALREIHAAPSWAWPALVDALLEHGWTVDATRKQAGKFPDKKVKQLAWINLGAAAREIVAGNMRASELAQMARRASEAKVALSSGSYLPGVYSRLLGRMLRTSGPARLSEVIAICNRLEGSQSAKRARLESAARERALLAQRETERQQAKAARLWTNVSLAEWKDLEPATRAELLNRDRETLFGFKVSNRSTPTFNPQESKDIEWAQWSWNPITGCEHSCSYCYARDLALSKEYRKVYPHGFDPVLRPASLAAPHASKVPAQADEDVRYRNVFTGSMADMWGRWVPEEWIAAVLAEMEAARQWNFLTLTKFPARMAEFSYSPNVWLGTTVDLQARVPAAEKAFAKVECDGRKWLSIEPMLEPLSFKRLDLFDFIVVGGASPVRRPAPTPAWHPPVRWIFDLWQQWCDAKGSDAGFYAKSNLLGSPCREGMLSLGADLKVTQETADLPDVFHYLKKPA